MVERYNAVGYDPGMTAAHGGSWVRYSDYARLQGQVETLTKERDCDPDGCKAHIDAFMARAEATEAERDRLRAAVVEVVEVSKSGADTVSFLIELNRVARNCAAALQKEPQP